MELTTIALLVLAPFLVWRIYSRVKSMMVRQRSILSRHFTGLGVFAALVLVAASEIIGQPVPLAVLLAGTGMGIGWGVFAFKRTRLEVSPEGYFFTPHKNLGMLIAMLFVARLLYAGVELYMSREAGLPPPHYSESLLTQVTIGLFAGYFATISAGLVRWRRQQRKAIDAA